MTDLIIETIRADQLYPGNKFLGPREFHITVESVRRTACAVIVSGVNGWGEAFQKRYPHRQPVSLLIPAGTRRERVWFAAPGAGA